MFYIGLYREKHEKIILSETRERSGSVVECLTLDERQGIRASPASLRCGP